MKTVKMYEAKTDLSKFVRLPRTGAEEEIVITLGGKPAARLVPYVGQVGRTLGIDAGLVSIAADFDAADATIEKMFQGKL